MLPSVAAPILGLFTCYVVHDFLQERAFRSGFTYGWFMTAIEIGTMFSCSALWEGGLQRPKNGGKYLAALVVGITVSQGTGSVALAYVNYPAKVCFKSAKLVPTMLFSRIVGKTYSRLDYFAAVLMCVSLALMGLAEEGHGQAHVVGFVLLTVATCTDALIPNLQEKLLRHSKLPVGTMVILSNLGSFLLVFFFIAVTGELKSGLEYCVRHRGTASLLLLQALAAYCGLRCYLHVVRALSGVAGVLTTSARKIITLLLSFLLFKKPFSTLHACALTLLASGIALAVVTKQRKGTRRTIATV